MEYLSSMAVKTFELHDLQSSLIAMADISDYWVVVPRRTMILLTNLNIHLMKACAVWEQNAGSTPRDTSLRESETSGHLFQDK
jgi:hypothetical protein